MNTDAIVIVTISVLFIGVHVIVRIYHPEKWVAAFVRDLAEIPRNWKEMKAEENYDDALSEIDPRFG